MNLKFASKTAEETLVENATETSTGRKPKRAVVGIKKGAVAAKQAASKIALAPAKIFDSAVYSVCYGISYGAVFTSLVIVKMLPVNSLVTKGFHDGAEVAHKDFKTRQEKRVVSVDSTVVN